jgi:GT2 family glycosyltransferase
MIFTVIMVSYNRDAQLIESIRHLLDTSIDEIVIVDNNSSIGTINILMSMAKLDSRINLILLDENKGASYGFYIGLKELEMKYDYFVTTFIDDDAYFEQPFLSKVKEIYRKIGKDIAYITPKVINKDHIRLNMNRPMDFIPNSFVNIFQYLFFRRRFGEKSGCVEAASFIGLTVFNGKDKLSELVPKEYFIYYDDLTFTYRLSILFNVKGMYVNNLNVIHDIKNGRRNYDEIRLFYMLRNCIKFYNEIDGKFFIYPFFVYINYFFNFLKNRELKVYFKVLKRIIKNK